MLILPLSCSLALLGPACSGGGDDTGGKTDGGSSEDGGSVDGGHSDGGASDGGSEDGGSADGGSSDGGSSDGGSSDGGSSDGGSSDGGSSDGGSSDGGSEDGGAETRDCVTAADTDGVTRVLWYHAAYDNKEGPDLGTDNEISFLDMVADLEAGTGWEIDVWYLGSADNSGPYPTHAAFNALSVSLEDYDVLFVESDEMALYYWPYWTVAMSPDEEPWTPVIDAGPEIAAVRGSRTVLTGLDVDFHAGEWRRSGGTGDVETLSHMDGARAVDGSAGLLLNMLQWAADGEGLGLVVGTMGGTWFHGAPLGLAWNTDSFLYPEVSGYWSDDSNAYDDVEILDATHPVNAGLTDADLSDWPGHGTIGFDIPGYVGIQQTSAGGSSPVGYVTAVKDACER